MQLGFLMADVSDSVQVIFTLVVSVRLRTSEFLDVLGYRFYLARKHHVLHVIRVGGNLPKLYWIRDTNANHNDFTDGFPLKLSHKFGRSISVVASVCQQH